MQKTVGDGRREEGHFVEPTAAASRSRRAWLCEAASPLLFTAQCKIGQVQEQAVQVHGQAAQVPGINGAGSKTGAESAPWGC